MKDEVIKPEQGNLKRLWVVSGSCDEIQLCSDSRDVQEDLAKERALTMQAKAERDQCKVRSVPYSLIY